MMSSAMFCGATLYFSNSIVKLPRLNHLFQTAKTGALSEYSQIEETMSPVALEVIGDWIVRHTDVHTSGTSARSVP